jgi:hypothetical protein
MYTYTSPYMLSKAKITSGGVFFYPAWVWSKGAGCYYSAELLLSLSLSLSLSLYYEIRAKLWSGIGPRQWEFLGRRILIGRFKPAFSSVHPASPSSHRPLSPAAPPSTSAAPPAAMHAASTNPWRGPRTKPTGKVAAAAAMTTRHRLWRKGARY